MKKQNNKFINTLLHCLTAFILILPILITMLPCFIAIFSEGLNITMNDINTIWASSMTYTNENFFTSITNTNFLSVINNVFSAFGITNSFIVNLFTYWILLGALCFLFNMIMKMFTYIIMIITPKEKV